MPFKYVLKAFECHRPNILIWVSDKPLAAHILAADILKECGEYFLASKPATLRSTLNFFEKKNPETGLLFNMKRGPGVTPLIFK